MTANAPSAAPAAAPSAAAPRTRRPRELTGRHVLIIALCAFAVILTANISMMVAATGSFPGLVAKNSYVASQDFNFRAARQAALGWRTEVVYSASEVRVRVVDADGAPVRGLIANVTIGRPANAGNDREYVLVDGPEGYAIAVDLAPGAWRAAIVIADPVDPAATVDLTARFDL